MIDHEIERIAAAIHQLRPDWPASSLRTLLSRPELRDRPRRDVAVALTWVACDAATLKPARVLEAGPWWQAAAVDQPDRLRRNLRASIDAECPHHVGEFADRCRGCRADELAGESGITTTRRADAERERRERALAEARAAIQRHNSEPEPDHQEAS